MHASWRKRECDIPRLTQEGGSIAVIVLAAAAADQIARMTGSSTSSKQARLTTILSFSSVGQIFLSFHIVFNDPTKHNFLSLLTF